MKFIDFFFIISFLLLFLEMDTSHFHFFADFLYNAFVMGYFSKFSACWETHITLKSQELTLIPVLEVR